MKLLWSSIYMQNNPGYWMFTLSIIILAGIGIYPFLRWKSQYTPAVKREHLRFILKGFLPFLITGWIGGSELGYTKEFLGAACYFAGFSSIFFRRYIRVLLRDLSKMPNYSCSEYQSGIYKVYSAYKLFFSNGNTYTTISSLTSTTKK